MEAALSKLVSLIIEAVGGKLEPASVYFSRAAVSLTTYLLMIAWLGLKKTTKLAKKRKLPSEKSS